MFGDQQESGEFNFVANSFKFVLRLQFICYSINQVRYSKENNNIATLFWKGEWRKAYILYKAITDVSQTSYIFHGILALNGLVNVC